MGQNVTERLATFFCYAFIFLDFNDTSKHVFLLPLYKPRVNPVPRKSSLL